MELKSIEPDEKIHFKGGQIFNDTNETLLVDFEERPQGLFIALRGFLSRKR